MKKHSLELLFRYRDYLLEKEQIHFQEKIEEEKQQRDRLESLAARIQRTNEAKLKAQTIEGLRVLDEAAGYLRGRVVMAKRALSLANVAREEAMGRILQAKQARDQIGMLLENNRRVELHRLNEIERKQMDDLASARHIIISEGFAI